MPPPAPQQGAREQGGGEDAACVAGTIASGCSHKLQYHEQQHHLQRHLAVQCVAHEVVANSEHPRRSESEQSYDQTSHSRSERLPSRWRLEETSALPEQQFHEGCRYQTTEQSENGINEKFQRVHQLVRRDVEERLVPQDQSEDDPGGGGADHDRTTHTSVQIR